MNEILMFAGYALAVGAFAFAMMTRRQLTHSQLILTEAANRFEAAKKKLSELESSSQKNEDSIIKLRESLRESERSMESARNRHAQRAHEIEELKEKQKEEILKEGLRSSHIKEQVVVLTEQLAENVREKKELSVELHTMKADTAKITQSKLSDLKTEITELQTANRKLSSELKSKLAEVKKIRTILHKVKPADLKKYKQKATSLDQLYHSMKGLRDMADARSKNWQTALSALSAHITGKKADTYESFGELVGEALEKVGAVLVKDEHTIEGAKIAEPQNESTQTELEAIEIEASALEKETTTDEQI
jgi:chromosome segregation ATPase